MRPASTTASADREPSWVFPTIAVSSAYFICVLVFAMFFDPTVRVLHPFQALIYVAIIYSARRRSAFGFGAGRIMAAFWNYIFMVGAHNEIWTFLTKGTGGIFIPLQLSAFVAHLLLLAACAVGFLNVQRRRWLAFVVGGAAAVGLLVVFVDMFRPQSTVLLRKGFGL
jgi:hypothetical protein